MEYLTLVGIIVAAAVVSTVIGTLWYSVFFKKVWMKYAWPNLNPSAPGDTKGMGVAAALIFVPLITGANPFILSVIYWIGFMIPVMKDGSLYEGRSWYVFFIGSGYRLVSLLAMSAVFYFL